MSHRNIGKRQLLGHVATVLTCSACGGSLLVGAGIHLVTGSCSCPDEDEPGQSHAAATRPRRVSRGAN